MSTTTVPTPGTNLTILVGMLSRDAELRTLPSGDHSSPSSSPSAPRTGRPSPCRSPGPTRRVGRVLDGRRGAPRHRPGAPPLLPRRREHPEPHGGGRRPAPSPPGGRRRPARRCAAALGSLPGRL